MSIDKTKNTTLNDLPQEIINNIAIESDNMGFIIEFADKFTIKKYIKMNPNAIHNVIKDDDVVSMQYIVDNKIKIKHFWEYRTTEIILEHNSVKIFKYMVQNVFDVDFVQSIKDWVMFYSVDHGFHEIIRILLELPKQYRISVAAKNHYAIKRASEYGHHKVVELLLNPPETFIKRVNINICEGYPVRHAAANGHYKVVKLLVDAGCELGSYHNKALQNAAENNHLDICKLLIDNMIKKQNK